MYLFVGERPSKKALAIGASWEKGGLAAKTLHEALRNAGVDPEAQMYMNLWGNGAVLEIWADDYLAEALEVIKERIQHQRGGVTVVGLGRKVQTELDKAKIPHLKLTHPAARGLIRKTERYQAHVAQVLKAAKDA